MFFTVLKADKPVAINGSAKESDVTENIMFMSLVIFFCRFFTHPKGVLESPLCPAVNLSSGGHLQIAERPGFIIPSYFLWFYIIILNFRCHVFVVIISQLQDLFLDIFMKFAVFAAF